MPPALPARQSAVGCCRAGAPVLRRRSCAQRPGSMPRPNVLAHGTITPTSIPGMTRIPSFGARTLISAALCTLQVGALACEPVHFETAATVYGERLPEL